MLTEFWPHWLTALASAFDLASPYALLLLPLPLLAARLMPPEELLPLARRLSALERAP
mgnify:CR=1 FL=1